MKTLTLCTLADGEPVKRLDIPDTITRDLTPERERRFLKRAGVIVGRSGLYVDESDWFKEDTK